MLVSYDGEVKMVDFGIAKAEARATETQTGVLKGKFAYMAPEQVIGADIDRRADIFALGAVLYEIVTGNRLFGGENDLSVLEKVREARTPDLNNLPPECAPLAGVLSRALQRDPDKRYSHASEMAEELEELLIQDRAIFGPKRASKMMHALYEEEVAHWAEQIRRYSEITADKVVHEVDGHESSDDSVVYNTQPRMLRDESVMLVHPGDFENQNTDPAMQPPRGGTPARTRTPPPRIAVENTEVGKPPTHTQRQARQQRTRVTRSAAPPMMPVEITPPPPPKSTLGTLRLVMGLGLWHSAGLAIMVGIKLHVIRPDNIPWVKDANRLTEMFSHFTEAHDMAPPPPSPVPSRIEEQAAPQDLDEPPAAPARYGYLWVKSTAAGRAKLYIDGRDLGYLPLPAQRIKAGQHEIRIIEEQDGAVVRVRHAPVFVSPRHSRKAPRLVSF